MSIDLEQVVLDGGARFVNFFEGRILTGRDLRDEQSAARQDRGALGRALGWGVVHGLEVTDATPSGGDTTPEVLVTAGIGVNRDGQALDLSAPRTVRLAELAQDDPARSEDLFGVCDDQPGTSTAPTAEGFHILTIAPAAGYEEDAPKSGLNDPGTAGGCGRRYVTLGLRFRLVRFDPALLAGDSTSAEIATLALSTQAQARSRLRSLVAHLGLGTDARARFAFDPFALTGEGGSAWADYGIEARVTGQTPPLLMSCELPLAVLRLRGGQIDYVDMWTMRRHRRSQPSEADWPLVATSGRRSTDAATLFQFQDQLSWLFSRVSNPSAVTASDYFRYLPPVGFLPLSEPSPFLPTTHPPVPLDPGRVIPLVEQALAYPAVDLSASPPPGFVTYRVTGASNWILFVSDVVPSAELEAIKCAALENRIQILEETLAAPGQITGRVMLIYQFGAQSVSQPFVGLTMRATADGAAAVDAVTDDAGDYTLSLPPGSYDLTPVYNDTVITSRQVQNIDVARGARVTQDLNISIQNLFTLGGPT